jgi:hypothetical protein
MEKLDKIYNSADEKTKNEFKDNTNSKLLLQDSQQKVQFDYSWLDKVEECIPSLDNIVRKPKKFIMQEEEVVNVEKAKKLTQESVVHLATHTNFIQKYDPVEDTVTPSKVLNINKEESYDIYENRFIYSLLMNLAMFMAKRKELVGQGSSSNSDKKYNYSSETKLGKEAVKFNLSMESHVYEDLTINSSGLSVGERFEKIQLIIADFMHSAFFKELATSNIIMVKSPIRKTNVILKNNDFKKALELWEFIERYNVNDKDEVNETKNYNITGEVKNVMDDAFLLDYLILNSDVNSKKDKKSMSEYIISKAIKDYVDNTDQIDENKFKNSINKEFKIAYNERIKRENRIESLFKKYFKKYKKDILKIAKYIE